MIKHFITSEEGIETLEMLVITAIAVILAAIAIKVLDHSKEKISNTAKRVLDS